MSLFLPPATGLAVGGLRFGLGRQVTTVELSLVLLLADYFCEGYGNVLAEHVAEKGLHSLADLSNDAPLFISF